MRHYQDYSDTALMSLLKEDNERAFAELFHRYKGVLFTHAYRMLGDQEEARDVVQELFTTLWTKRQEIVLTTALAPYLYRSVRHRILDYIAHKKIETSYLNSLATFLDEGHCLTDHPVRERELNELIEQEVALLPPKMREVFELSRKQHLSYQEIAETLNISDKTVKKQVHNALTILRTKLDVSYLLTLVLSYFL